MSVCLFAGLSDMMIEARTPHRHLVGAVEDYLILRDLQQSLELPLSSNVPTPLHELMPSLSTTMTHGPPLVLHSGYLGWLSAHSWERSIVPAGLHEATREDRPVEELSTPALWGE
jgi:hypothetical protein